MASSPSKPTRVWTMLDILREAGVPITQRMREDFERARALPLPTFAEYSRQPTPQSQPHQAGRITNNSVRRSLGGIERGRDSIRADRESKAAHRVLGRRRHA